MTILDTPNNMDISYEQEELKETSDFSFDSIMNFNDTLQEEIAKVATNMREDDSDTKRSITITLGFKRRDTGIMIDAKIKTSLPTAPAIELPTVWGIRQNGTIMIEKSTQTSIFDKENA